MGFVGSACMVTGAPIRRSDWVVGLVIHGKQRSIPVYPWGSYRPLGGPIYGRCNGYNGVEPVGHKDYHAWLWQEWKKTFDKGLLLPPDHDKRQLSPAEYADDPEIRKFMEPKVLQDLEDMFTHAERDDSRGITLPKKADAEEENKGNLVKVALIHRWAWDIVCESGGPLDEEELDLATLGFGALGSINKKKDNAELPKKKEPTPSWKVFTKFLSPYYSGPWWYWTGLMWTGRLSMVTTASDPSAIDVEDQYQKALREPFIELYNFMMGLVGVRGVVRPCPAGSQTYDAKTCRKLYEKAAQHV